MKGSERESLTGERKSSRGTFARNKIRVIRNRGSRTKDIETILASCSASRTHVAGAGVAQDLPRNAALYHILAGRNAQDEHEKRAPDTPPAPWSGLRSLIQILEPRRRRGETTLENVLADRIAIDSVRATVMYTKGYDCPYLVRHAHEGRNDT